MSQMIWAYDEQGREVDPTAGPGGNVILTPRFGPPDRHRDVNDVVTRMADAIAKLVGGCWYIFMHVNGRDNRFAPESLYPRYLFQPPGTPVITIHHGEAHSAVTQLADVPEHTAYLNRSTGQIVFTWETREDAAAVIGEAGADDSMAEKATIEASPDEWLEIPKSDFVYQGDSDEQHDAEERHFYKFLADNGINGQLV